MSPTGSEGPANFGSLQVDALREAVRIYLSLAYPTGTLTEAAHRRLDWPTDVDVPTLLAEPPFERAGKNKSTGTPIHALRLGNANYPHMKLQVQPWPNEAGYMISVNTHDQVLALDPNTSDLPAFRLLQAENQKVKEAIEQAWDEVGLPTFNRYLRDYIGQRGGAETPPEPA
jgi:hypothetical protein